MHTSSHLRLSLPAGQAGVFICGFSIWWRRQGAHRRSPAGFAEEAQKENLVIVELKSVNAFEPIHTAQLLTYLRLMDLRSGSLLNFNVERLKDGIKRVINGYGDPSRENGIDQARLVRLCVLCGECFRSALGAVPHERRRSHRLGD